MKKKLTRKKSLEIKKQIDEVFISNDLYLTDVMSILIAMIMHGIRSKTSNKLDENLKESKFIYEIIIKAFKAF